MQRHNRPTIRSFFCCCCRLALLFLYMWLRCITEAERVVIPTLIGRPDTLTHYYCTANKPTPDQCLGHRPHQCRARLEIYITILVPLFYLARISSCSTLLNTTHTPHHLSGVPFFPPQFVQCGRVIELTAAAAAAAASEVAVLTRELAVSHIPNYFGGRRGEREDGRGKGESAV